MAQGVAMAQVGMGFSGPALSPYGGYSGPELGPGTGPSQACSPMSDEGKIRSLLFGASAFSGALGTGASVTEYSAVQGGRWFDFATGNWYRFGYYGNQWRGAESVAASKLGALRVAGLARALSVGAFGVGVGVAGVEGFQALRAGDLPGVLGAGVDIGVGYVGLVGGVAGAVFSGAYFVLDVSGLLGFSLASSAAAPEGAEGAPSYSFGAGGTTGY